jgi:DNA invertase Pin-like site-specific DNA recombinase
MKYILYCRKSTDSEDRQVLSLDSQEKELMDIAKRNNLQVIKIFKESRTAKEAGRPIFNEVINMIKAGKADAILCWKLDRLARNFLDGGLIMDMLQKGVIKEIRTYEAIHLPNETAFIMAMQFGMANQYSRDLSVNVKRGNRAKLEQGGWPHRAPFGYQNDKATTSIVVDPVNSKYVVRIFMLYGSGMHGFKEIAQILYDEGLRTCSGKKVHFGHMQRYINNPFYYGIMFRNGKYYPGIHTPIITKQLYDQAQNVLHNRNRPRMKNHFFALRGFIKCENCGCSFTASTKKSHQYYYCTNSKGGCEEHKKYSRETALYGKVAEVLEKIDFEEENIEMMYLAAKEMTGATDTYAEAALKTLQKSLNDLTTKESRLLDAFLAEQISKDIYDSKVLELQNERVSLSKQIKETETKLNQGVLTLEPVKEVFLRASRAKKEFLEQDDYGKRKIVSDLLWNLSIRNQNVANVSFKSPYDLLTKLPKNANISQLRG